MIDDIIGHGGGGGKGGGGGGRTPVESPDSLRSRSTARILDLISEGEIEGLVNGLKSIYLDDTPIQNADGSYNFTGLTVDTRNGTQHQSYIPGFPSVENEVSVEVEVKNSLPVVRSLSNVNLNAIRVRIMIPTLTYQNPENGDLMGTSVTYAIDQQPNGSGWIESVYQTINGKTTSRYERQHRIQLIGSGPWNIRIRRLTSDSTQSNMQNKTYLVSFTEIIDGKLRYPNSALVALTIDSQQFRSIPRRGYLVKLLRIKVPTNYDPTTRQYSGIWNGSFKIAWSDNPAWCFYDLLTNPRYGLGDYISNFQIDKWSLYKIAQYCDQLVPDGFGGTEPRFTCNMYLQTRDEAYNVLQNMASIFRGMIFWQQGSITAVQDSPEDPVYLYTNANVIDGLFTYSGSSRKSRHTVALVTWNDPADSYRQKIEYVEDPDGIKSLGVSQTEVIATGCTSRGQAHRVGKWIIYSEKSETELVEFKTGLDGALARPGQIIKIADQDKAGTRIGGRLIDVINTSTVILDSEITLVNGVTYNLSLITPAGIVEERPVQVVPGTSSTISVSTPYSFTPTSQTIWILSSSELTPAFYRVLSVSESGEENTYTIGAIAHNPSKYNAIEYDLNLEEQNTSILSVVPGKITNLTVSEYIYLSQGDVRTSMTVSWIAPSNASRYSVEYRIKSGGNWTVLNDTLSTSIDILDVKTDTYEVRVRAISVVGLLGPYSDIYEYQVLGKTAPPSDVLGFRYELEKFGIRLLWNKNLDLDLKSYELRYGGTNWDDAIFLDNLYTNSFFWNIRSSGTHRVWIKAIDTSGNYSVSASYTDVVISVPAQSNLTARISGPNIVLEWDSVVGSFSIDRYDVRYGNDWLTSLPIAAPLSNSLLFKADFGGSRIFWVAAVDVAGNIGTPTSVSVNIQLPIVNDASAEVIDNNVLLRWLDGTASLPIDYYEVRKGADFITSVEVGIIYSRFATVFEQAAGQYIYWIVPVDSAGNRGTAGSVSTAVSQPPDYVLRYNHNSEFNGDKVNTHKINGELYGVLPEESWQEHFQNNSWNTIQDQINSGNTLYFQPSILSGSYDEIIDYGTIITLGTTITITPTYVILRGSVTFNIDLYVKANLSDPWTEYLGQTSVYVKDFRYIRFKITIQSASGSDNLIKFTSINVKLAVKRKSESGSQDADASDIGGTVVNLTPGLFIDIDSIDVSPAVPIGGQPRLAMYDFVDVPNPTQFKVLLYDLNGNRVSGAFSWSAKGV